MIIPHLEEDANQTTVFAQMLSKAIGLPEEGKGNTFGGRREVSPNRASRSTPQSLWHAPIRARMLCVRAPLWVCTFVASSTVLRICTYLTYPLVVHHGPVHMAKKTIFKPG